MRVEVVTPDEYTGDIIGDLNSRRGQVSGMEPRGNAQVIDALVPLAAMFGYVNTLRSMSQGRAQFTMQFECYSQVPQNVACTYQASFGTWPRSSQHQSQSHQVKSHQCPRPPGIQEWLPQ